MKIEDQVCSLQLSQSLKELGVPQDSNFWWLPTEPGQHDVFYDMDFIDDNCDHVAHECPTRISAFTVAELGQMLPPEINGDFLEFWKKEHNGNVIFLCSHKTIGTAEALSEADVRAKFLIDLIKNGIVKP